MTMQLHDPSNQKSNLEAPSWLWSGVVSLIAEHEVAYLEHCRRFVAVSANA